MLTHHKKSFILITMSKRLQVLIEPREYLTFRRIAREAGVSLGEWVRLALRRSAERASPRPAEEKLRRLRTASRHAFPSGDIDTMLQQIEQGYRS